MPFGIIFGMTVFPRWTIPATVKPLGPTDTNYHHKRKRGTQEGNAYHARSSRLPWQFLCHETINKSTVDHQTDKKSSPLDTDGSKSDCHGVYSSSRIRIRQRVNKIGSKWTDEQKRICRENPNGSHGMDGKRPVGSSVKFQRDGGYVTY
jgi:hypothetical protein